MDAYPYSAEMSDEKVTRKERGNFITKKIRNGDIPKSDAKFSVYQDQDWAVVKQVKERCLALTSDVMSTELDLYQPIRLRIHQGTPIESAQDDNVRK